MSLEAADNTTDRTGKSSVAVIIPCYNEALTIAKVVDDFKRVLPDASIYVYDNNSTDGTGDIAREHGAQVRVERRQGKGNVVRQMMRDIDADYYIMVDGDDTYPAEAAPELLAPLMNDEADMVVGDRLSNGTYGEENDRAFHGFGNNLVRFLIKAIYGFEFSDVMTGYRAYNEVFAKSMPVLSPGFEIETELSIHAVDKRWRIAEVPIDYRDRPEGGKQAQHLLRWHEGAHDDPLAVQGLPPAGVVLASGASAVRGRPFVRRARDLGVCPYGARPEDAERAFGCGVHILGDAVVLVRPDLRHGGEGDAQAIRARGHAHLRGVRQDHARVAVK